MSTPTVTIDVILKETNIISAKVLELVAASGAKMLNFSEYKRAFGNHTLWSYEFHGNPGLYAADKDVIVITENYSPLNKNYVVLHELIHWSGNAGRLNRIRVVNAANYTMTGILPTEKEYATEEMIAQIGSHYIALALGFDLVQTLQYRDLFPELIEKADMAEAETAGRRAAQYILDFVQMKLAA